MPPIWSSDQRKTISCLYKIGRKFVSAKSHVDYLCECLSKDVIPKCFLLKNNIPGNKVENERRIREISQNAMIYELEKHQTNCEKFRKDLETAKDNLKNKFSQEIVVSELNRFENHFSKIRLEMGKKKQKKILRDGSNIDRNTFDSTIARDDEHQILAHKQKTHTGGIIEEVDSSGESSNVTLVGDDEHQIVAHIQNSHEVNVSDDSPDVTIAGDDEHHNVAHKKRKRKFKRFYNQPQPKKVRKRKRRSNENFSDSGWNNSIKNISGVNTSNAEELLLSKGKKFCPVELDPPIIRMQKELKAFYRNLRIKWHFRNAHDERTELEKKFYERSDWEPPKASAEIERFIENFQHKFDTWKVPFRIPDNLSKEEREFLKSIKNDENILYMWEDKGASFTKLKKSQYLSAGEAELQKVQFYEEINSDPVVETKTKKDILVQRMQDDGEITEKVSSYLLKGGSKLPKFYHLLKTHNIPVDLADPRQWLEEQGFPVRGIISGVRGPTERLASFIDHFLQPGMKNLGSFLKDTKHTLQLVEQINEKIDKGELSLEGVNLVSLDVEKMYNNISKDLGMNAVKEYLDSRDPHSQSKGCTENEDPFVSTKSILEGLDICIDNNCFSFNEKVYRQVGGVGTGQIFAPPYACLAMGHFEKMVFNTTDDERKLLELILLWKRFIDDILLLFKGTEDECQQLVNWLNGLMPGQIKLKCNFSRDNLEFLDLRIMIINGRLETEIFVKPTNLQIFLDYTSNHPTHCKDAIVYSQALRVVGLCSQPDSAKTHLGNLSDKFRSRNYPENVIQKSISRAESISRKEIIFGQRKQKKHNDKKVRLIFTYNSRNPPLHKWLREGKKLLTTPEGKEIAKNFQIVNKQSRNLKQLVTGLRENQSVDRLEPSDNPGCFKCNRCRVSCPILCEGNTFRSRNTKKSYRIQYHLTCDSVFVIYLASCKRCGGQYVGKSTTPFKKRHSNHRQEIKHGKGGIGHHFGPKSCCGIEHLSIILIDQVKKGDSHALEKREQFWQHQLRVFVENGYNAMCIRKDFT